MDIGTNGSVAAGNGGIGYGASGACTVVNAANPNLTVNEAGTTTTISGFTPSFQAGDEYTVVAYPGASGSTQFATFRDTTFVPNDSSAGLRVFNAAAGASSVDVFVGSGTTASASGVTFGNGSSYFNVPAGRQTLTFNSAGTSTTLLTAANQSFASGANSTLIIEPPAAGSTSLGYLIVPSC